MVMRSDGTLWAYNNVQVTYENSQPFIATSFSATTSAYFTTGTSGSSSSGLACAVDTSGYVWCWGSNSYGELGNGTTTSSNYPVQVQTDNVGPVYLSNIAQVFVDGLYGYDACAIDTSGNVWCWGYGNYGVLGQGPGSGGAAPSNSSVAVEITQNNSGGAFTNVTSLSLEYQNICALVLPSAGASASAGEQVWCWGYNYYGQVGVGSTTTQDYYYPVQVTGLYSSATSIGVGSNFACASTTSGNVYCWGYNGSGQLGIGNTTTSTLTAPSSSSPVVTTAGGSTPFANVTSISSSYYGTCALKSTNGSLWCWGEEFSSYPTAYVEASFAVTNVYNLCSNGSYDPSYIDDDGYFHYDGSKTSPQITCQ